MTTFHIIIPRSGYENREITINITEIRPFIDLHQYTVLRHNSVSYNRIFIKDEARQQMIQTLFDTPKSEIIRSQKDIDEMRKQGAQAAASSSEQAENAVAVSSPATLSTLTLSMYPLLNQVDGMIVSFNESSIGKMIIQKTSRGEEIEKPAPIEYRLVGYLKDVPYIIKTWLIGRRFTSEQYNKHPKSVPPILNVSVEGYLKHTTCFKLRRRGRLYCMFYVGQDVLAVDRMNV
jgi:hypothetical protein